MSDASCCSEKEPERGLPGRGRWRAQARGSEMKAAASEPMRLVSKPWAIEGQGSKIKAASVN